MGVLFIHDTSHDSFAHFLSYFSPLDLGILALNDSVCGMVCGIRAYHKVALVYIVQLLSLYADHKPRLHSRYENFCHMCTAIPTPGPCPSALSASLTHPRIHAALGHFFRERLIFHPFLTGLAQGIVTEPKIGGSNGISDINWSTKYNSCE